MEQTQDRALKPQEVADVLNVTVYTIHQWLRDGTLRGVKFQSHWRVMQSDLDSFIAERRTEGRSPVTEAEA